MRPLFLCDDRGVESFAAVAIGVLQRETDNVRRFVPLPRDPRQDLITISNNVARAADERPLGTDLARGEKMGDLRGLRPGNYYAGFRSQDLPGYIEPEDLNKLPPVAARFDRATGMRAGMDKRSLFHFFNRAHVDHFCNPRTLSAELQQLRGGTPKEQAACAYLAERVYKRTDQRYGGTSTETRPHKPICEHTLGIASTNNTETFPVFLAPGYVRTPGLGATEHHRHEYSPDSIANWCAKVPVLTLVEAGGRLDIHDRVAIIDRQARSVGVRGAHFGSARGTLSVDGTDAAVTRWSDNEITFSVDPGALALGRHRIQVVTGAGVASVGVFKLDIVDAPMTCGTVPSPPPPCIAANSINGDVTIANNSDISQLDGKECVLGDIRVEGTGVTALPRLPAALRQIRKLIVVSTGLTDPDAFSNVRVVGGLEVRDNPALVRITLQAETLSGFPSGNSINNNPALHTVNLAGLRSVGKGIFVFNNAALSSFTADRLLVSRGGGRLSFRSSPALATIRLPCLEEVYASAPNNNTGQIELQDLPGPIGMLTFPRLRMLEGAISLYNVDGVTAVNADALERRGLVSMIGNDNLQDVSFGVMTDAQSVHFKDNPSLATISMPQLAEALVAYFENLPALTTLALPLLRTAGPLTFTRITGLTTLSLPSLTNHQTRLNINRNDSLTSLDFPSLTTAGNINIHTNPALASLAGLSRLERASLGISANPALTSLGLTSLVTGSLSVGGNLALTSLDVPSLTTAGALGVVGNRQLPACDAVALLERLIAGGTPPQPAEIRDNLGCCATTLKCAVCFIEQCR